MFDMGFIKDLRYILRKLPPFEKRQTMLFSATLSPRVMELAYEFMNLAEKVRIEPEQVTAETDRADSLPCLAPGEVSPAARAAAKKRKRRRGCWSSSTPRKKREHLAERLKANDFKAAVISGDIPQKKRMRILDDFKDGRLNFLVATDVASRGMHIEGVTHVINYDLPQDAEDYVHRIGRTARAGAEGKAISFADEDTGLPPPRYRGIHRPENPQRLSRRGAISSWITNAACRAKRRRCRKRPLPAKKRRSAAHPDERNRTPMAKKVRAHRFNGRSPWSLRARAAGEND